MKGQMEHDLKRLVAIMYKRFLFYVQLALLDSLCNLYHYTVNAYSQILLIKNKVKVLKALASSDVCVNQ